MNKKLLEPVLESPAFSPSLGEHIGAEAGAKMVKTYFDAHPDQAYGHLVGREIIEKILAQPGCAGLSIYPGYNKENVRQLVFTGVDSDGQQILQYTVIGDNGLETKDGIVADKISTNEPPGSLNWFA
jgi:hypothetical protein